MGCCQGNSISKEKYINSVIIIQNRYRLYQFRKNLIKSEEFLYYHKPPKSKATLIEPSAIRISNKLKHLIKKIGDFEYNKNDFDEFKIFPFLGINILKKKDNKLK